VDPQRIRLLFLCCFSILEKLLLSLAILLLPHPIFILAHAIQDLAVYTCDVNHSRGRDNIAVVDTTDWNSICFERSCNEKYALGEVAEENDALATETTREEDHDCAWCERFAIFGGVCGFTGL